jgi:ATP-dependent phosphofructokinase / diphosphate-dependent phosphofructokinase
MRIGLLTGGGDCPGLNAVIRAVVRGAVGVHGHEVLGFENGWSGVVADDARPLPVEAVSGILHRGGTILGSSGTDPTRIDGGIERVRATVAARSLDGIIAIGGEGTLGAAAKLTVEGVPVIGVPKTIDNDLAGNDFTVGFHTAVQVATDAIDRLHSTAESHDRVIVVEVMGRHAGWIALYAGIAGGADAILIPEHPFDLEEICRHLRHRHMSRNSFSIVVVGEGALPAAGTGFEPPPWDLDENGFPILGGIANLLAPEIARRTGYATRVTILGHVQRGGTPVAFDRMLATRLGLAAVDLVNAGGWGRMVALAGVDIVDIPLGAAVATRKGVPPELYRTAEVFFG